VNDKRPEPGYSPVRIISELAEGSLVAMAFALAILLIGTPIALLVRGVHASLSWLAALRGDMLTIDPALVSVASSLGALALTALFARALVVCFRWRRTVRELPRASWNRHHKTPFLPAMRLPGPR
jgi:hypothetical protein